MQKLARIKARLAFGPSIRVVAVLLVVGLLFACNPHIYAANNSQLSHTISAGTLATDIRDASLNSVASPSVSMGAVQFSFSCLTGGAAPAGTLGTNTERLYVDNPGAAGNGWTLALAATGGPTTLWQNTGSSQNYDFNDAGSSGCSDGADADTKAGQLTVNPSVGTITAHCATCSTANITKGSSSAYAQGSTDSITLLNAAAASDDYGRYYLTGVGLSQTIPTEQPVDSYTLNMTLTVTAS
jgi:hypothetical protein